MGNININEQAIKGGAGSIKEKNNEAVLETASLEPTGISRDMTRFSSLYNRVAKDSTRFY